MNKIITTNQYSPNTKLLKQLTKENTVFAYPGETGYSLGCAVTDLKALERIRAMRQLSTNHNFTICCNTLKTASQYAVINNEIFKLMKKHTPAAITFILPALATTPRKLSHKKRRNLGIRIPSAVLDMAITEAFSGCIITTSAINKDEISNNPISAFDIEKIYHNNIDYILETEPVITSLSTIIDCTEEITCIRKGQGKIPSECAL